MRLTKKIWMMVAIMAFAGVVCGGSYVRAVTLPDPLVDSPKTHEAGQETLVVAGGCFWGIQAVFQHVKGVKSAVSGYAGGDANTAHYDLVSNGNTGHAESVQITYDPSQITLGQLLKIFFSVAHDPTQLNRQGPDHGSQYRSAIFVTNDPQRKIVESYLEQLKKLDVFSQPIVTQIELLKEFYPAEDYHQNYARLHPDSVYIVLNDAPKVEALKSKFPDLYSER